ncbi:unnamed protein product, partial [Owenia fusiformis]
VVGQTGQLGARVALLALFVAEDLSHVQRLGPDKDRTAHQCLNHSMKHQLKCVQRCVVGQTGLLGARVALHARSLVIEDLLSVHGLGPDKDHTAHQIPNYRPKCRPNYVPIYLHVAIRRVGHHGVAHLVAYFHFGHLKIESQNMTDSRP